MAADTSVIKKKHEWNSMKGEEEWMEKHQYIECEVGENWRNTVDERKTIRQKWRKKEKEQLTKNLQNWGKKDKERQREQKKVGENCLEHNSEKKLHSSDVRQRKNDREGK